MSPRQGTSFLCCAKERRQRKALNASLALGASGQATSAHRGRRAHAVDCQVSGANRRPGIPAGLGIEDPKRQAKKTDRSNLFVAESPWAGSLVSRAGTPARLALPVFAPTHTGWPKDEQCIASPLAPRAGEALSAFLWFRSMAQQRKELARRGLSPEREGPTAGPSTPGEGHGACKPHGGIPAGSPAQPQILAARGRTGRNGQSSLLPAQSA